MNKHKETFGVDISKDVFDVHGSRNGQNQYKSEGPGFRKFLKDYVKFRLWLWKLPVIVNIDPHGFFTKTE